jgi:hypothetical protein
MVSLMSDVSITVLLAALTVRYLMWEGRRERTQPPPGTVDERVDLPPVTAAPDTAGITS